MFISAGNAWGRPWLCITLLAAGGKGEGLCGPLGGRWAAARPGGGEMASAVSYFSHKILGKMQNVTCGKVNMGNIIKNFEAELWRLEWREGGGGGAG